VLVTPYPHLSYQIAQCYHVDDLEPAVLRIAATVAPFVVETTGLGVFTGARPVLYIPVVRGLALSQFQAALWQALAGAGSGISDYYHPDRWMPHITIGFGDTTATTLAAVVAHLSDRDFSWRMTVTNLAFIQERDGRQELRFRYDLTGRAPSTM
jgi:2'-5' RNA ligase